MTRAQVFAAVAGLTDRDFYKTMESERVAGLWQDVYRPVVSSARYRRVSRCTARSNWSAEARPSP